MVTPPFERFVKNPFAGRLITFDPGETTGYSIWDNSKLVEAAQLNTYQVKACVLWMKEWLKIKIYDAGYSDANTFVCMEEYRVYAHKTQDHAQNTMHTSRLIGSLETHLTLIGVEYEMRGAGLAKKWADDQKLKDWGFWAKGQRHARDAIRHGCYFLCHSKRPNLIVP